MDRNNFGIGHGLRGGHVALRKESVDRNDLPNANKWSWNVALRKESVDRNIVTGFIEKGDNVALRKESMECFYF